MSIARSSKVIFRALLLLFFFPALVLYAADAVPELASTRMLLLQSELDNASASELQSRAIALGVDPSGGEQVLRERLRAWYGISVPSSSEVEELAGDRLTIVHADRIHMQRAPASVLLLEGRVVLDIRAEGEDRGITVEAARVAVDLERRVASALGNVRYTSDDGKKQDILEGMILTLNWSEDKIQLAQGGTSMLRGNSEGDEIRFHASGSKVFVSPGGKTISFKEGFVTTNREQAYFSIAAKSMHMVDGGDLFVTDAKVSLGRVPMLWLPFFYYPGRTFIFNPSFGVDTERGWFFSSSTELYGRYPKIERGEESSFTSLLSATDGGETYRDGWVYASDPKERRRLDAWADASGSYMALLFDAYRNRGVFMGFDSVNNLYANRLVLSGFGGIAFPGSQAEALSSVYGIGPVRYGLEASARIESKNFQLSYLMPLYSDPRFMRDYGNRLTAFSLGAIGGNVPFPQTYRSDSTGYDWVFSARAAIPVDALAPFVGTVRIERLNARFSWKALLKDEGSAYRLDSITLPDLSILASGTVLDIRGKASVPESERAGASETPDGAIVLEDWGIATPYVPAGERSGANAPIDHTYLNLGYTVRQIYTGSTKLPVATPEVKTSYARLAGSVTLKGAVAPSIISFAQKIDPLYTVNVGERVTTEQFTLASSTDATLASLGLTYGLTMRLYHHSKTDPVDAPPVASSRPFSWDRESVSRHQVSWRRPFSIDAITLVPSVTATLDPLPFSLVPKLEFIRGRLSASASYRFADDGSGALVGDDAVFRLSYLDKGRIEFASSATYRGDVARTAADFWSPVLLGSSLSIHPFGSFLSLSQSFSYDFEESRFERFSLSAGMPWASASLQGSTTSTEVVFDLLDTTLRIEAFERRWWKNRMSFTLDLDASYRHSFWDTAASSFTFRINSSFSIAEFLSLDVALTTVNRGLHRYGSFGDLWEDLLRSLDFFGEGRNATQFTMETVEVSLVHHMADWDLHCKYQGSVVLSDLEWRWKPVFTVFLQWKAIPEIKVDRRFEVGR